jgi:hypothetical protein
MTKRRADSQRALLAALKERLGGTAETGSTSRAPWASATFTGTRHRIELMLTGAGARARADALGAELPELEFHLPGHLVAEIAMTDRRDDAGGVTMAIEALTIEED